MKQLLKNKKIVVSLIIVLILILLLLPIKISYRINTTGKVLPVKEWFLIRGADGNLMTSLINNRTGVYENYTVSQFNRGDAAKIETVAHLEAGSAITMNDTIIKIFSNDVNKEIAELYTDLNSEEALLSVLKSKEKQAVIQTEKENVAYAERQVAEQERLYQRKKQLFEKNLISQEEYEIAEGAVGLFKINRDIAKQRLQIVMTGAKPEEIEMTQSKIKDLKKEIAVIQKKMSDYVVLSPVSGVVSRSFSADTLMIVHDTTEFILLLPITVKEIGELKENQEVVVNNSAFGQDVRGTILNWEKNVRNINQKQFFIAAASVENAPGLYPGSAVECYITVGDLILRDYLFKGFLSMLAN
ncbi:MAG: hypothetical protein V1720_20550 [bacterium]